MPSRAADRIPSEPPIRRGSHGDREDDVVDRVDAEEYEPYIVDGTQVGENHGLAPQGSSANDLDVSLWRSDPATYDYLFEKDEAFHVRRRHDRPPGHGERIELRTGDVADLPGRGMRSVWTITEPFEKFVVLAG